MYRNQNYTPNKPYQNGNGMPPPKERRKAIYESFPGKCNPNSLRKFYSGATIGKAKSKAMVH